MQMSEQIDKLAEALSAAQGMMKAAIYDNTNPHFKARYATLTAVMEAARPALSQNGIALIQSTVVEHEPLMRVGVTTMLMHTSGQWIRSTLYLKPVNDTPQAVGSALTYARRYSLSALVAVVADEDDDAEKATGRNGNSAPEKTENLGKPAKVIKKASNPKPEGDKPTIMPVTTLPKKSDRLDKMREIFSISARLHQSPEIMKGFIGELLGLGHAIRSSEEIPDDRLDEVLAHFREEVAKLAVAKEVKAA